MRHVIIFSVWVFLEGKELLRRPMVRRIFIGAVLGAVALLALLQEWSFSLLVGVVVAGACLETTLLCERVGTASIWYLPVWVSWWLVIGAFRYLYHAGVWWALLAILVAASADIGAMVIGRRWGKAHLPGWLSPGKTLEGTVGGLASGTLVGGVGLLAVSQSVNPLLAFGVGAGAATAAVLADLAGSVLKRRTGIKRGGSGMVFIATLRFVRWGRILEASGHGGCLDRAGSHAAVAVWLAAAHVFGFV